MEGLEVATQCAPCPTGFFCPDGTFSQANKCDAGYYCHSGAAIANDPNNYCYPGYYCLSGTQVPTICDEGYYSEQGAKSKSDCTKCTEGYYCVTYVTERERIPCPEGHYCPEGVNLPQPCPQWTYYPFEKGISETQCKNCPRGTHCDEVGISKHENHLCPPGYYCPRPHTGPDAGPPKTIKPC